jgi:hypothetical protein
VSYGEQFSPGRRPPPEHPRVYLANRREVRHEDREAAPGWRLWMRCMASRDLIDS